MEIGCLPYEGGLLDQPAHFVSKMYAVVRARRQYEYNEIQRASREAPKK